MYEIKEIQEENKYRGENIVPEFLGDLPKRNTKIYSTLKIFLKFILLLTLAFASGMLFCEASSKELLSAKIFSSNISSHFTGVFDGCSSFKSYASVIVSASAPDIRYLLLIFTSGFTYFCGIADSIFIICKGFTIGFSFKYLISITKLYPEILNSRNAYIVVFLISELSMALFLAFLATKTLFFAYDFRKLRGRKSQIIRSPAIYRYILLYLTSFGLVFIINILFCVSSLIIYR